MPAIAGSICMNDVVIQTTTVACSEMVRLSIVSQTHFQKRRAGLVNHIFEAVNTKQERLECFCECLVQQKPLLAKEGSAINA